MANEILFEVRNKLTTPKIVLEKLAKGERVPWEFLDLAAEELKAAVTLLPGGSRGGVSGRRGSRRSSADPRGQISQILVY